MSNTECTVQGCTNRPRAKTLCSKHYEKALLATAGPCSFKDCDKPSRKKGLCESHYRRALLRIKPPCTVEGCLSPQIAKGICEKHRSRLRRSNPVANEAKNAYARAYRKLHLREAQHSDLMHTHGISLDDYELMVKQQNNKCAICEEPETVKKPDGEPRNLAVDHCHGRDLIRGLLCSACNMALGGFKDDPKLLRLALDYLLKDALE